MAVIKQKLLFEQIYPCLSDRAYVNLIIDDKVVQEGLKMDTDFSKYMVYPVKEIDPDLQKINNVLTVGVMNVILRKNR